MSPDIETLAAQLDAAEDDAVALAGELDEGLGCRRPDASTWSVAECLDHLAVGNRVYLRAMLPAATRARRAGRSRRRPAVPGLIGGWFVKVLEPPVRPRLRARAPRIIRPRGTTLADALTQFRASQQEVREFLRAHADLDLAGVRFPNPFVMGVRFSLATGLHVIAAHERRHLWQARRIAARVRDHAHAAA